MNEETKIEWVVNEYSELGVLVNGRAYFLYKGASIEYKKGEIRYRKVFKREFGECCHPWGTIKDKIGEERLPDNYVGFYDEDEKEWNYF